MRKQRTWFDDDDAKGVVALVHFRVSFNKWNTIVLISISDYVFD